MKKGILIALLVTAFSTRAFALDEIYSPHSEQGELSLEYNGSRTFDSDSTKNNEQEHEIALEYGFNNWFTGEVSGGFQKDPDSALRLVDGEIEGRFQFTEPGEYWIDTGALVAYDFSTVSHQSDTLETKLLLQKDFGRVTTVANIGFEQSVGQYHAGGPDWVLLANARYRFNDYFQPGIELQSDFGQGGELGHFSQQEQYLGPAAYGKIYGRLNYQVAWLAGISDASASSAARVLLEYEMHF